MFALGEGRRRAVPLVGESPGVERREPDCGRGVREEELVARSVDVDAERELLDPLGCEGAHLWESCLGYIACALDGRVSASGTEMRAAERGLPWDGLASFR